jgi:hypothetical protein
VKAHEKHQEVPPSLGSVHSMERAGVYAILFAFSMGRFQSKIAQLPKYFKDVHLQAKARIWP